MPDRGGPGKKLSAFSFQLSAVSRQLRIQKGFSHQRGAPVSYEARRFDGFWPAKPSAVRLRLSKIRSVAEQRAERFAALRSRARAGSRRFAGASVRFVVSGAMIPASEAGRVPRTCHVPGSVDWAPDRDGLVGGRSRRLDLCRWQVSKTRPALRVSPECRVDRYGTAVAHQRVVRASPGTA